MQGTRLPDAVMGEPGLGWEAWGGKEDSPQQAPPGAYMRVVSRRQDGTESAFWYIKDPSGDVGTLGRRNHTITEHDDGTITVSPSILSKTGNCWHGYLERGVWRSC